MKKIKRQELILLAAWIIIIAVVGGERVYRHTASRLGSLDDDILVSQGKLNRLKAIVSQEKKLNAEYEDAFSGYSPVRDSDSLLQQIDQIAKSLNVNLTNIKPGAIKQDPSYTSYSLKIEGQDDVYSVARFLNTLVEKMRGISIERIQFTGQNRNDLPKVLITVNALVFK